MTGWVKLHRSILDWEWYDDHNTTRLFIHLVLKANHKPAKWRGQDIERGQTITSLESLQKETGLTVSQIRTSIKKLISTSEIASKSQAKNRVITVLNYDSWQVDDKQVGKLVAGSSQGSDNKQECNNNQEEKEDKKPKRKVKTFLPDDFEVTDSMKVWAIEKKLTINISDCTDNWKNAMLARGQKNVDWTAAWRNGMKLAQKWLEEKNHQPQTSGYKPARGFGE